MAKGVINPKVDWYFVKNKKWQEEIEHLRSIALDCGLNEELKWGKPCYTYQKSNVVLIHGFKEYCALLYMKGALLKDPTVFSSNKRRTCRPRVRFRSLMFEKSWRWNRS